MAENNAINNDIGVATGTSLNLGSTTNMTGMIDDDTFATASANLVASSESIKNYVDNFSSQIFLAQGNASASSSLVFTDLDGYDGLLFTFIGILPSTNGVSLRAEVSTDNGSTFLTTAGDYSHAGFSNRDDGTQANFSNASASNYRLTTLSGNSIGDQVNGNMWCITGLNAGRRFIANLSTRNAGVFSRDDSSGMLITTLSFNAIRFRFSSGTIAAGRIQVYAIQGN